MKISITYAELQDYVASHFHKTINLGYVDGATLSVSVPIKVLGFTKSISINLIVKKIEGTDLFLSYDGKMGYRPACFARYLLCQKTCAGESRLGGTDAWRYR